MSYVFDLSPAVSVIPLVVMMLFCFFIVWSNMRIRKLCDDRVANIESGYQVVIREMASSHDIELRRHQAKYKMLAAAHDRLGDQFKTVSGIINSIGAENMTGASGRATESLSFCYPASDAAEVSKYRSGPGVFPEHTEHGRMVNYRLDVWLFVPSQPKVSLDVVRPSLIAFGARLFAESVESEYEKSLGGNDARV